jgi:RNA polymerase sigma-70 factor (ECF subfamily)
MQTRTWSWAAKPGYNVTVTNPTDSDLVAAALAGDHAAFGLIVERHGRNVYQLCYRFTGDHADASDLTQDVFIRAYRSLRTFRGHAALGTWLYRIAVNVSLNRLAKRSTVSPAGTRLQPLESLSRGQRARVASDAESPTETLLRGEEAARVRAAIARLPKKQRATLILRVYHELPHEEIARILGSSVGAVKANFFHALKNLRKLLA